MAQASADPGVTMGRIASAIPVSDIDRALGFYRDILGMRVTFTNGDPIGFVILKRDGAELHLTLLKGHRAGTHNVAHLMIDDATRLHDYLAKHGVRIIKGLRDAAPEELFALWQRAVDQSRADVAQVLDSGDGVGRLARQTWPDGRSPSLRWILCHMVEEYARHNGHADLLRESIDGATGE